MTAVYQRCVRELRIIFAGREEIPSIGQFSEADTRRLAWGVKHGLVFTETKPWPGPLVGTCTKRWYVRVGF